MRMVEDETQGRHTWIEAPSQTCCPEYVFRRSMQVCILGTGVYRTWSYGRFEEGVINSVVGKDRHI